uniref:Peptidyl-prolyl cis-trans isomerase cyp15 n=1 Tax=Lygus hesperus TaxID=30085 RepID=A0A0A9XQL4_LYGHE
MDPIAFGRAKNAVLEKERYLVGMSLGTIPGGRHTVPYPQALFDQSDLFLLYPSIVGIKVVNIRTKQVVRVLGRNESTVAHFSAIALFQGRPSKSDVAAETALYIDTMIVPANTSKELQCFRALQDDPCIFASVLQDTYFCVFSTREPDDIATRNVGIQKAQHGAQAGSAAAGNGKQV